jgi:EmrB/QacA subfamily drug resistance transporter
MPAAPDRPTVPRRHLVLAASALGAFAATVMATGVNVVLPGLVEVFDTPFATVQWVVLSYLLASIALLPVIGRLGDVLGKRSVFLSGFVVFGVGSALCALAPTIEVLIAVRTIQGLGSAVLASLGLALVTDVYPQSERGRAIGVNGAVISAGVVLGPSLGGLIADLLSWRWVFGSGVLVVAAGWYLAWRVVPRGTHAEGRGFDVPGAVTVVAALVTLSLALTTGQAQGFAAPSVLVLFGAAALLTLAFVAIERRVPSPVLDLALFREPALSVGLATGLATFVSISGVILLMPFYLQGVLGFAPRQVGLLMAVVPVVLVIMAPIAGWAADRFGERPVTVLGLGSVLLGYLLVGRLDEQTTVATYLLSFLPVGLGMGTFQTPNNSAIMGSVRRARSGTAGGLLALTRNFGQVLGVAVLASVWSARAVTRAGAPVGSDATRLAATAQVGALQDVVGVVQVVIALALALAVWDWWRLGHERAAG